MAQQLDISGHTKEEEAIEFLREHEPQDGYMVGFSGGKDSIVCEHIAKLSGVKYKSYHAVSGIDPPSVLKFIKQNYPYVIFIKPEKSFFELLPTKGYPTIMSRWCCDVVRKAPFKKLGLNHRILGMRAEESSRRAKFDRINKLNKKVTIYRPIFHWKEFEIWEFIEKHGLKYPSIYDEGFDRTGCVVCPFICSKQGREGKKLKMHMEKYPAIYRTFERAMYNLYENKDTYSFSSIDGKRIKKYEGKLWYRQKVQGRAMLFEEFLENWYRGR
jgi:phosphoadenosine phosphosulfate reductase